MADIKPDYKPEPLSYFRNILNKKTSILYIEIFIKCVQL